MKKLAQLVCVILVFSFLLAVPAQAAVQPRESAFFAAYAFDLEKTSASTFRVWYDVVANAGAMDEIGASEIIVYRSADQQSWTKMRTYTKEMYPSMVDQNTGTHGGYVTYSGASAGYYYTAYIVFYAKNSTGWAENYFYTEIIRMG